MTTVEAPGIGQVIKAVNNACKERTGVYVQYQCQIVSWDDAQRGTVEGGVSQWGANITDSMLLARDGTMLFTVRPDNWNEKLARVSASQVALLTGNHMPNELAEYANTSLENYLKNLGTYGWYAGLPDSCNLYSETLDTTVGIRFQTTFLPVEDKSKANIEFCAQAYNYNTLSDRYPANLSLLCTTQGTAVQQDGAGAKKLFHHRVADDGSVHRHWFEAERSEHAVGGEQVETEEEKQDALARGKAIARIIGIEAMNTRFNVLMTIQVPLVAQPDLPMRSAVSSYQASMSEYQSMPSGRPRGRYRADEQRSSISKQKAMPRSARSNKGGATPKSKKEGRFNGKEENITTYKKGYMELEMPDSTPERHQISSVPEQQSTSALKDATSISKRAEVPKGQANAARVSLGSQEDVWAGLTAQNPKRHASQHITITVVIYNTVAGGVPTADDVIASIDDMEALYKACEWSGHLTEDGAGFAKKEMTVKDVVTVGTKLQDQPLDPNLPADQRLP